MLFYGLFFSRNVKYSSAKGSNFVRICHFLVTKGYKIKLEFFPVAIPVDIHYIAFHSTFIFSKTSY